MAYDQSSRLVSVDTPLGPDVFVLKGFSGREEMSRLFSFQLELMSERTDVSPKDLVGKAVSIRVGSAEGTPGRLHGIVRRLSLGGSGGRSFRVYRAEVVPWLWFLTRNVDCRIFQQKTAKDIIEQVFKDRGFSDFEMNLTGSFATREYCVQYHESDFEFVSRLMEEEGIFYFFRHEESRHVMVLGDSTSAYADCDEAEVSYFEGSLVAPHVGAWQHDYDFPSGKYAHTDYNYETPATNLLATTSSTVDLPGIDKYEVYEWPGTYETKADGDRLAKIRMEEIETPYTAVAGAGNIPSFHPGGKFTLTNHPLDASESGQVFAITSVEHMTSAAADALSATKYRNSFTCIPAAAPFRAARTTSRPVTYGCQTAVVVGPSGEEIYTDKYGRVKVQFIWDRVGKKDENSSCWIRVAQGWAGNKMGFLFTPRIGQEVIVDFLDGDPDRPIITGCVYNAVQMPPYDLPADQTFSGIITASTKGGTADNWNAIAFRDTKGEETMLLRAEKDFLRVVKNNDALYVGHDESDDGSQVIEVYKDRTETVKTGNETITIESGDRLVTITKGKETLEVKEGDRTVTVAKGKDTLDVTKGDRVVTVGSGKDSLTVSKGDREVTIDIGNDTLTISKGNHTMKLDVGSSTIDAMQGIELKCGQSSIKIDQTGVTIKGMNIAIQAQLQVETKQGLMAKMSGDAMLTAKGAISMFG